MKQCARCARWADDGMQFCPACGQRLAPPQGPVGGPYNPHAFQPAAPQQIIQVPSGSHSVFLAVLASIIFGGWLGSFVNLQTKKALTLLFVNILGVTATLLFSLWVPLLGGAIGLVFSVFWLVSILDAIVIAMRLNRGERIRPDQWF